MENLQISDHRGKKKPVDAESQCIESEQQLRSGLKANQLTLTKLSNLH